MEARVEYVVLGVLLWIFLGLNAVLLTFWIPSLSPKLVAVSRWANSFAIRRTTSLGLPEHDVRRRAVGQPDEWHLHRIRKALVLFGPLAFFWLVAIWRMKKLPPLSL